MWIDFRSDIDAHQCFKFSFSGISCAGRQHKLAVFGFGCSILRRSAMSLIPRNSLFDLDDLFAHFWMPDISKEMNSDFFSPRVDIKEKKGKYEITADLPGVEKENISVTLDNGVLTIEASTEEEKTEEEDGKVLRKERRSGRFVRSFNLG